MILISVIAVIGMMTLFSTIYFRFYEKSAIPSTKKVENEDGKHNEKLRTIRQKSIYNYFTSHMIYVINIMTNQGKASGKAGLVYNLF